MSALGQPDDQRSAWIHAQWRGQPGSDLTKCAGWSKQRRMLPRTMFPKQFQAANPKSSYARYHSRFPCRANYRLIRRLNEGGSGVVYPGRAD